MVLFWFLQRSICPCHSIHFSNWRPTPLSLMATMTSATSWKSSISAVKAESKPELHSSYRSKSESSHTTLQENEDLENEVVNAPEVALVLHSLRYAWVEPLLSNGMQDRGCGYQVFHALAQEVHFVQNRCTMKFSNEQYRLVFAPKSRGKNVVFSHSKISLSWLGFENNQGISRTMLKYRDNRDLRWNSIVVDLISYLQV